MWGLLKNVQICVGFEFFLIMARCDSWLIFRTMKISNKTKYKQTQNKQYSNMFHVVLIQSLNFSGFSFNQLNDFGIYLFMPFWALWSNPHLAFPDLAKAVNIHTTEFKYAQYRLQLKRRLFSYFLCICLQNLHKFIWFLMYVDLILL